MGLISTFHDFQEIRDAPTTIGDTNHHELGRGFPMDLKLDLAPTPVIQGVASYLRNGCGNPGLVLPVKTQQLRDLTGALANQNDIVFEAQLRGENAKAHGSREVS